MKIRVGFVSNSSAASFCIYGWTNDDLGMNYSQSIDLANKLREKISFIITSPDPDSEVIVGVGHAEDEIDHWYGEDGEWEDYQCEYPDKDEMTELDTVALEFGLPKPILHQATWFNG
jgi:hypothetical protein